MTVKPLLYSFNRMFDSINFLKYILLNGYSMYMPICLTESYKICILICKSQRLLDSWSIGSVVNNYNYTIFCICFKQLHCHTEIIIQEVMVVHVKCFCEGVIILRYVPNYASSCFNSATGPIKSNVRFMGVVAPSMPSQESEITKHSMCIKKNNIKTLALRVILHFKT